MVEGDELKEDRRRIPIEDVFLQILDCEQLVYWISRAQMISKEDILVTMPTFLRRVDFTNAKMLWKKFVSLAAPGVFEQVQQYIPMLYLNIVYNAGGIEELIWLIWEPLAMAVRDDVTGDAALTEVRVVLTTLSKLVFGDQVLEMCEEDPLDMARILIKLALRAEKYGTVHIRDVINELSCKTLDIFENHFEKFRAGPLEFALSTIIHSIDFSEWPKLLEALKLSGFDGALDAAHEFENQLGLQYMDWSKYPADYAKSAIPSAFDAHFGSMAMFGMGSGKDLDDYEVDYNPDLGADFTISIEEGIEVSGHQCSARRLERMKACLARAWEQIEHGDTKPLKCMEEVSVLEFVNKFDCGQVAMLTHLTEDNVEVDIPWLLLNEINYIDLPLLMHGLHNLGYGKKIDAFFGRLAENPRSFITLLTSGPMPEFLTTRSNLGKSWYMTSVATIWRKPV